MAEEFLSQEEVNLLLQALGKEEETKTTVTHKEVKPLDISTLEHISASRIAGLELILERWVSSLKRSLSSVMVSIPAVLKEGVSVVRFSEFVSQLPFPSAIGFFNVHPLRGVSMLVLDPRIIYMTVSSLFGGPPKPYKIEGKEFTKIELRIVQKILEICYRELEEVWNTVMEVKVIPQGLETNPSLLTIARPKEKFIVLKLLVSLEGSEGYMYLAIPEESLDPYKEVLKGITELRSPEVSNKLLQALEEIPLNLEVILGRQKIQLGDLLNMKVGDTMILQKGLREPVEVRVSGVPKALAFLGQVGKRKAIKILRFY
ncbi:flagellar motor switch protein FliM [Thermocrinis albus DSM 14484]|uniref:Flagellar motor switch protein FliM n=1 Tax=Thermocrinis albus (strain DSM 14484 / JCM 11386 / HI 11/12) TaxID=638303 RepID=D3SQ51_THEAH|nr:flagellar motor switch protein FliM [Thermocrinis albus]ADC89288.1 flagellar motor switch protein FliM [Thermocrinis albus DSM 14484]